MDERTDFKRIEDHIDSWGLINQAHGSDGIRDGGDSLCETCSFIQAQHYKGFKTDTMWKAVKFWCIQKDKPWLWRRHPSPYHWFRYFSFGTGDQIQNFIICCGLKKDWKALSWITLGFMCRGFFCTNTRRRNIWPNRKEHLIKSPTYKKWTDKRTIPDFRPFFLGQIIRSYVQALPGLYMLYPLLIVVLLVTDFFDLFLGALLTRYTKGKKVLDGDDHNYVTKTEQARRVLTTPISAVSRKIYMKRPMVHPEVQGKDFCGPISAFRWHFRGLNPPLDTQWLPIIRSWYR